MQVLQDFPIGSEHPGLVISDRVSATEVFDDWLRFAQLVPGESREQVVFDLVVEATVPEVGDRVGEDVPAGQYLPVQEIHLTILFQNGHCFVVGREDRDHVHTEEPTEKSEPKYNAKCTPMTSASASVLFAFFLVRKRMLLACMPSA